MSFKLVQKVIRSERVEGMHKLVLIVLADFVNDDKDNGVWPAKSRVANMVGCSPRHIARIIRNLEQDGLLRTTRRAGINGTNRYYIDLEGVTPMSPEVTPMSSQGVTFETGRGDTGVMGGVTFETSGGDTHVTQTYKEQTITNKATSVAAPGGAGGALVGTNWESLPARLIPCNHNNAIMVNECTDCFGLFRKGEWKPDTPNAL